MKSWSRFATTMGNREISAVRSVAPDSLLGDVPPEEFREAARRVSDWMADYLRDVGGLPVLPAVRPGAVKRLLPPSPPVGGESLEALLDDFREIILPGITHWNHPSFFGYFSITGSGPGILGEMIAAALNVNAMVWRSSPAATELEGVTMDWLRQLIGLPAGFDGVINDTASHSTLYALAAAREVAYPESHGRGLFGLPPGRIYASDQAHSSVEKAVLTLGFGQAGYRAVPSDGDFRMDVDALRRMLQEDTAAGVRPVAVVATLGTTSTTSVDPVGRIAEVAREFGAWLHVDAAYGGPAAILPEVRESFSGWEEAESIVVNPHKWLFTPVDCSVLYSRRPEILVQAFSIVPEYLRTAEEGEVRNLMDYGVALGRRFRSLKLWFVLRYFGRDGLAANIRAHMDMARELEGWVRSTPGWEIMAPVPFGLVCFRYAPDGTSGEEQDELNQRLLDGLNRSGEAFLTHTRLRGRLTLRLAIGNLKTTRAHVERAWEWLRDAASS
ncbi:MAG: pyridoxal-dependent decarboxylase [Gemmatimonadota bacterium]|nr:pyridoxal-dependent decarboxylase [Gemmatimonadota bacterium]MDH5758594.1 pyridoxal-dependent decarboxylase [Gemmatimonadota bacterium]